MHLWCVHRHSLDKGQPREKIAFTRAETIHPEIGCIPHAHKYRCSAPVLATFKCRPLRSQTANQQENCCEFLCLFHFYRFGAWCVFGLCPLRLNRPIMAGPVRASPDVPSRAISSRCSLASFHCRPLHAYVFCLRALPCRDCAIISLENNYGGHIFCRISKQCRLFWLNFVKLCQTGRSFTTCSINSLKFIV